MKHRVLLACAVLVLGCCWDAGVRAQSSQASVFGRVQAAGKPASAAALILIRNLQTNVQSAAYANAQGFYLVSGLAPGAWSIRAYVRGYQPQEQTLELTVSMRAEINFDLKQEAAGAEPRPTAQIVRPPAAAAAGDTLLARLYGADAAIPKAVASHAILPSTETLSSVLSNVVDERRIQELGPLLELGGSDIYNLLLLQPGVTSDNATARGLGSSVNGQRYTSSNFLLDGVDNNDALVTGPATRISSDAVREFRVATNGFSAEFGRGSGFIAHAITRSGTNLWHGTAFEYFKNDALNANSFANNWQGIARPSLREQKYGGTLGGPFRKDSLFAFGSFERLPQVSGGDPRTLYFPSSLLDAFVPDNTLARRLLTGFPPPGGEPVPGYPFAVEKKDAEQFNETNTLGLGRLDWSPAGGRHRLMARYGLSRRTVNNIFQSYYKGLDAPIEVDALNPLVTYSAQFGAGTNELKFGWNRTEVRMMRPHAEIATMFSLDGVSLPGSEAAYDYSYRDTAYHLSDAYARLVGRHSLTTGFEWRQPRHDSLLSPVRDGYYLFDTVLDFAYGLPTYLMIAIDPETGRPATNDQFRSVYHQHEWAGFVQDVVKLTPRVSLNAGLRWEYFGVPSPGGATRTLNYVGGAGNTLQEQIAGGSIKASALFHPDRDNFAPRAGVVFALNESRRTVLRASYGLFFDRIFNNFWLDTRLNRTVNQLLVNVPGSPPAFQFTSPASDGVLPIPASNLQPPTAVMLDPGLRTPYTQSWFYGLQHQLTASMLLEVNQAGSLGRQLLSADTVNRLWSLPPAPGNSSGRLNPRMGNISYRANQGHSDFLAVEASLTRRWSRGMQWQVAYTFSRTRDVQSDPVLRASAEADRSHNLTNPSFFQVASAFTHQFDPQADWGLSNFDQAHNLVATVVGETPRIAHIPRIASGWQLAALVSVRSGFPFSVYTTEFQFPESGGIFLPLNRADYVGANGATVVSPRSNIDGGVRLLDPAQFRAPDTARLGNTARNAFRGPGFWNADLAAGRSFPVPRLRERARLHLRVELFNALNHTNLDTPNPYLESSSFGEARYGRQGFRASIPVVLPLNEQPRRIQLAAKLVF